MTHKRLRKLLLAIGVHRNNVEDVIHEFREGFVDVANESVYKRCCYMLQLYNVAGKW